MQKRQPCALRLPHTNRKRPFTLKSFQGSPITIYMSFSKSQIKFGGNMEKAIVENAIEIAVVAKVKNAIFAREP